MSVDAQSLVIKYKQGENVLQDICIAYQRLIYKKAHETKKDVFIYEFEDIVQEFYVSLIRSLDKYDLSSGNLFVSYLYMSLSNSRIEMLRKQSSLRPSHLKLLYIDKGLEEEEKKVLHNVIAKEEDFTNVFLQDYQEAISYATSSFKKNRLGMINYYLTVSSDYEEIGSKFGVKYDAVSRTVRDFRKNMLKYFKDSGMKEGLPIDLTKDKRMNNKFI